MKMSMSRQPQVMEIEPTMSVQVIPATMNIDRETNEMTRKKVCAYCRVSTDQEEQQSSYDLQVDHYTKFIKSNSSWEYSGVYADEGISGTSTKKRDEFLKMIEDCKERKIDMVITKSISRFARNTLDCLNYVRMLKGLPNPVGVYFEKENIDTLDAKSELLLTILSSLAQDESRSISENVRWSIQKRFQQGKAHCPTTTFLGYDKDAEGNLIINEVQAKTIRRIFNEFLSGNGTNKIALNLTKDKVKTGTGRTKWTGNAVYRMLRNEKYCGDILMQKRVTVDFLTHKRVINRGHQPQYFIADHHPAIISKDDWNAVQIELDRRYNMNKGDGEHPEQRHSNRSPFSNTLFCGKCGDPYIRRTFTTFKKGQKQLYGAWKCRVADGRKEGLECDGKTYREISIEHGFMDMLQKMKLEGEKLLKDANRAIAEIDLDSWEEDRLEFLKLEIDMLDERLTQVASATRQSVASDVYDDMSLQIASELDILQNEKDQLLQKHYEAKSIRKNLEWLQEELKDIEPFITGEENPAFREDIFKRLVKKGYVYEDGLIIYELAIGISRKADKSNLRVWNNDEPSLTN
jgi:DNA invertase Pin-like site-specific DNA recombinase